MQKIFSCFRVSYCAVLTSSHLGQKIDIALRLRMFMDSFYLFRPFLDVTATSRQTPDSSLIPLKSNGGLPSRLEYG